MTGETANIGGEASYSLDWSHVVYTYAHARTHVHIRSSPLAHPSSPARFYKLLLKHTNLPIMPVSNTPHIPSVLHITYDGRSSEKINVLKYKWIINTNF